MKLGQEYRNEIDFFIACLREGSRQAYDAIKDMPLDEQALVVWADTFHSVSSQLSKQPEFRGDDADGYVYLFQSGRLPLYKVGITTNIPKRIKSLQTGNPHKIALVDFLICKGAPHAEQLFHEHFKHRRQVGEWFRLNGRDVEVIRKWFREGIPTPGLERLP